MKTQHILFFALIMLFSSACAQSKTDNTESKNSSAQEVVIVKPIEVSPAEFKEKMNFPGVQIIDVRTDDEVAGGMIPNAVQMNVMDKIKFSEGVDKLDPEKPVLVYCKSGGRSAKASAYLVEKGFKQVYDLQGGFTNWVANDGEVQIPK